MTLGGLTLAISILVDDATVTIENIERHLHLGKDLYTAIFDGASEIALPALTGAIMTMGVATANSILMVSFAHQRLAAGVPPLSAALEAGANRIRPVLRTALAMIIGMVPMALALGEGAE